MLARQTSEAPRGGETGESTIALYPALSHRPAFIRCLVAYYGLLDLPLTGWPKVLVSILMQLEGGG